MYGCCLKNGTALVGLALTLAGLIIVLCCVPFWLWLAVLGCLLSALGICFVLT